MAIHNKYPTECFYCHKLIPRHEGFLQRTNGKWYAHCRKCYDIKHKFAEPLKPNESRMTIFPFYGQSTGKDLHKP